MGVSEGRPAASTKLPLRSYVGYGAGDFAFNLSYGTSLAYSVYFYIDICRIPAGIVATMILVAKIANALIDPLIGMWVDHRGHGSRARPFLLFGSVPFGLLFFLSFIPINAALPVKIAWAGGTCFLLSVVYSGLNIPYGILTNLMAQDSRTRVKLVTWRFTGANVGMAVISFGTLSAVAFLGHDDPARGFTLLGLILGLVTVACCIATWATSHELVEYQSDRRPVWTVIREVMSGSGWLAITGAMTSGTISLSLIYGMAAYYAIYVCGGGTILAERLIGVMTIMFIFGCLIAPSITMRLGVKRAAIAFNVIQAPIFLALAFQESTTLAIVLNGLIGLMVGLREPSTYTLLSNSIDGDAKQGGAASIGMAYALNSAFIKLAMGLAGGLIGWLLSSGGYEAGNADQAQSATLMIRLGYGVAPALFVTLTAIFLSRYPDRDGSLQPTH